MNPFSLDPLCINPFSRDPLCMNPFSLDPLCMNPFPLDPLCMNPFPLDPLCMNPFSLDPLCMNPFSLDPLCMNPFPLDPLCMNPFSLDPLCMNPFSLDPLCMNPFPLDPLCMNPFSLDPLCMNPFSRDPLCMNPFSLDPLCMNPFPLDPLCMNPFSLGPALPGSVSPGSAYLLIPLLLPLISSSPCYCRLSPRSLAAAAYPLLPLPLATSLPCSCRASLCRRTPGIGVDPSAMARMTAVAMQLPGLLMVFLLGAAISAIAIISFTALDRDARAPVAEDNATCLPPVQAHAIAASAQQAHAINLPFHTLLPMLVLYSVISTAIATLMALLWGMGVTHTQVRAWVHQQGLAVTAGLMKLKTASKCLLPHHAYSGMQRVGEAVRTIGASIAGTHELKDEGELNAVKGEVAEQKDEVMKLRIDLKISQSEGDAADAWEVLKSISPNLDLSEFYDLSDDILAHLSTMTHLKSIFLYASSGFTAEGIKLLYRLTGLESLDLTSTNVSDSFLEGIESLVSLTSLSFQHTNVSDAGLSHLTALTSLNVLELSGCDGVTDAGMVHVGRLTGLEKLDVDSTAVTNDGLQQLNTLTKLTYLKTPEGGELENGDVCRRIGREE
ncbi:unnamed protein product [Closterium sp. Yama58-4]|nr:unnamed protein product [Closterium sp. Yama58-4]